MNLQDIQFNKKEPMYPQLSRYIKKLILADEPTGNLDSRNSQDVIALLTQASRRFQQAILMITHNKSLTSSVDRVLQVSDGVLTDLGGMPDETLS